MALKNTYVTNISSSSTLDLNYQTFVFNNTTNITVTLPSITTNGVFLKFIKSDLTTTNRNVTFQASNNIKVNNSTIIVPPSTLLINSTAYIEMVSYNSEWLIVKNITPNSREGAGLFSSTYVANNGDPYLVLTSAQSDDINYIGYVENAMYAPTKFKIFIIYISGSNPRGFITLLNPSSGAMYTTPLISIVAADVSKIYSFDLTGFQTNIAYFRIRWDGAGGANEKMGIQSILIT